MGQGTAGRDLMPRSRYARLIGAVSIFFYPAFYTPYHFVDLLTAIYKLSTSSVLMPIHVGIALFFTPGRADYLPAHFHWALAVTDASNWTAQPVRTMQLLPSNNRRAFQTQDLLKDADFTGIVHFLSTKSFTVESIENWILESFPCSDSKWRLPGNMGRQRGGRVPPGFCRYWSSCSGRRCGSIGGRWRLCMSVCSTSARTCKTRKRLIGGRG
ncbi:hypothetical protein CPB85DRAFT_680002 [Mucidula mucida]|nr:hypothetical protein CPB85DRAFT_680002 [Mucidula mucida]